MFANLRINCNEAGWAALEPAWKKFNDIVYPDAKERFKGECHWELGYENGFILFRFYGIIPDRVLKQAGAFKIPEEIE